jgi:septal ring factor EnvC (AmiA/AmiB activator)
VRAVPRLCEFCPGICLTTEEKARKNLNQGKKNLNQGKKNLNQGKKNLNQGKKNLNQGKKNLSQVKKNLSHSTVYILPKHPHISSIQIQHSHNV